jgi:hypothetical protein
MKKMSVAALVFSMSYGQSCFPFTDRTDINVDLGDPSNPLEYFCTPETVEVIARETNQYAHKFLESA